MKKSNWPVLALFAAAAAVLRAAQCRTGFDADGLAIRGNVPGALLPAALALAAAYFIASARSLPSRRDAAEELSDRFGFRRMPAKLCAVAGACLMVLSAESAVLGYGSSAMLPAVFLAASACCLLYTVFALSRGSAVQGVALLVPVCCLVVYLIVLYRSDASDPVLARIYVEILAVALLTYSAVERAAFAFRNGSPRVWVPVCAMAVVLSVAAAAELQSLTDLLFFLGCALVELGFLCAAKWEA